MMSPSRNYLFIFGVILTCVLLGWYAIEKDTSFTVIIHPLKQVKKSPVLKHSSTDRSYFATFAIAIPSDISVRNKQAWSYVFHCVPTVMSWKRIGFKVIVFIALDYQRLSHRASKLLKFVLKHMTQLETKIVYIDVKEEFTLRLSQNIRMFTSHLVRTLRSNDFIITGDSDLWPINKASYYPPPNITILSTAGVGAFKWKGRFVRHIAMSCVGMPARLWKYIYPINFDVSDEGHLNKDDIDLPYLSVEGVSRNYYGYTYLKPWFKEMELYWGDNVYKATWHGGLLWYMDQWYLSLGIDKYGEKHGYSEVLFMGKRPCKRIARTRWELTLNYTECRSDAHVLQGEVWADPTWTRLMMLIKELYSKEQIEYLNIYRKQFGKQFNETLAAVDRT